VRRPQRGCAPCERAAQPPCNASMPSERFRGSGLAIGSSPGEAWLTMLPEVYTSETDDRRRMAFSTDKGHYLTPDLRWSERG
jgi:hypothetical protein